MTGRRAATRLFTFALRAFPPDQRAAYGCEMVETFERELTAEAANARNAALGYAIAATADAIAAGIGERMRQRQMAARRSDVLFDEASEGRRRKVSLMGMSWLDVKLGVRMLLRYPGLTVASGLALALAIGLGAGWYDVMGTLWRPALPLPGGERIVEIEMRNPMGGGDERRILHDFVGWRRDLQSVGELSAYRTTERNLILGDARPEAIVGAEVTASTFKLTGIAPLMGRQLDHADEHPGAPPVVVLSHLLWQQRLGGRADVVGQVIQLGRTKTTVVGVMPEGYTFPVNHRMWMPLKLEPAGYAPLEGVRVRVFGRLAPGATQAQANAEVTALVDRTRAMSARTHEHLTPRVLAYGGESPGDRGMLEFAITHLPILLVLLVACANVGTLIYARTATREAEIATRYALGAGRARIVGQLFVEALVLASISAVVGLVAAHAVLKRGVPAYYEGQPGGMPFWIQPGLKPATILFAIALTLAGAGILGILPALKVTGRRVQAQLRNLGAGGSTLKFGWAWTGAMIAQVALTVICIPPAMGISEEAIRDRRIRDAFPAEQYLTVQVGLDRETTGPREESAAAFGSRFERIYSELERRLLSDPEVRIVTFGDRLPGMNPAVQRAEVEVAASEQPRVIPNLWTVSAGRNYFQAFDAPILAGRDFHDGDRTPESRAVVVNEAFARRYFDHGNPVGRRVRFASPDPAKPEPWFEIVGMVRDIGMTPTDDGEAPYLFRAVMPATVSPMVMGVRVTGDPSAVAPRLRATAVQLDPALRLEEVRSLEDTVWRVDVPLVVGAGAIVGVVALGLCMSAAGIFSLMAVSVARRTREIGLRSALGATQGRLLLGVFRHALVLIGSGILAGNAILLLFIWSEPNVAATEVWGALAGTSAVMLTVGLLACVEPARRALRIQPTDALKEA